MKKILPVIVTMAVILAGCAAQQEQPGTGDGQPAAAMVPEEPGPVSGASTVNVPEPVEPDYATEKMSVNGVYNISYRSVGGAIRVGRIHCWELTISYANGQPVNDARVLLSGTMPADGYSLSAAPMATRAGFSGLYRVEDLLFNMPGRWTVTIEVMADHGMPDRASFDLNIR